MQIMGGIDDLHYEERMKRANMLIKRVKHNGLERKLKKNNPDLEINTLNLQWIDDMIEERGIEYHLRGDYRGYRINVIGYIDIDDLLLHFETLIDAHIQKLTRELARTIESSLDWQYMKFRDMAPEELEKTYKEMEELDRIEGRD